MSSRAAILLLVCATLEFFLDRETQRGTFDDIDRALVRWLQASMGPLQAPANVVLVELRDGDLDPAHRTFDAWPPEPLDYALLFEGLFRLKPATVAVEPVLSWPQLSALDASTLAERVMLLPRGVLSCVLTKTPLLASASDTELRLPQLTDVKGDIAMIPEFSAILVAPAPEVSGPKPLAFARIDPDEGLDHLATSVRLPMLARHGTCVVPSLTLQTLLNWSGMRPDQVKITLGEDIAIGPSLRVRIDRAGRFTCDLKFAEPLPRLDASSLVLDASQDDKLMPQEEGNFEALQKIANAVVVLGDTTTNAQLRIPRGGKLAFAEVMAHTLASIQTGRHVREVDRKVSWAIVLIVALAGLVQLRLPRGGIIGVMLAFLLTLATAMVLSLRLGQLFVPPCEGFVLSLAVTLIALLLGGPQFRSIPPATPAVGRLAAVAGKIDAQLSSNHCREAPAPDTGAPGVVKGSDSPTATEAVIELPERSPPVRGHRPKYDS